MLLNLTTSHSLQIGAHTPPTAHTTCKREDPTLGPGAWAGLPGRAGRGLEVKEGSPNPPPTSRVERAATRYHCYSATGLLSLTYFTPGAAHEHCTCSPRSIGALPATSLAFSTTSSFYLLTTLEEQTHNCCHFVARETEWKVSALYWITGKSGTTAEGFTDESGGAWKKSFL